MGQSVKASEVGHGTTGPATPSWGGRRAVQGISPPAISHLWVRNWDQIPEEKQAANEHMLNLEDALCYCKLIPCVQ